MNATATSLPTSIAIPGSRLVAAFSAMVQRQSALRDWAFAAAVRLSDQDKPIVLKLLVELAIVLRMLAALASGAGRAPVRSSAVHRAGRGRAGSGARAARPGARRVAAGARGARGNSVPRPVDARLAHRIPATGSLLERVGWPHCACSTRRRPARIPNDRPSDQRYPHLHPGPGI